MPVVDRSFRCLFVVQGQSHGSVLGLLCEEDFDDLDLLPGVESEFSFESFMSEFPPLTEKRTIPDLNLLPDSSGSSGDSTPAVVGVSVHPQLSLHSGPPGFATGHSFSAPGCRSLEAHGGRFSIPLPDSSTVQETVVSARRELLRERPAPPIPPVASSPLSLPGLPVGDHLLPMPLRPGGLPAVYQACVAQVSTASAGGQGPPSRDRLPQRSAKWKEGRKNRKISRQIRLAVAAHLDALGIPHTRRRDASGREVVVPL